MELTYVVDPTRWGRGYGRIVIKSVLGHPDVADVERLFCGIDADNHASQRCCTAAGFHLIDPRPDQENMLFFRREHPRHG
jgi:RimJ/RimL family protein N-acetyltransferase